jgi:hypothetical protein
MLKLVAIDSFERYQAHGGCLETRKFKGCKEYSENVCGGQSVNIPNIVIMK